MHNYSGSNNYKYIYGLIMFSSLNQIKNRELIIVIQINGIRGDWWKCLHRSNSNWVQTDEELITYYLWNKVLRIPLPAEVIQDIDATEIYSMPPDALGKLVVVAWSSRFSILLMVG